MLRLTRSYVIGTIFQSCNICGILSFTTLYSSAPFHFSSKSSQYQYSLLDKILGRYPLMNKMKNEYSVATPTRRSPRLLGVKQEDGEVDTPTRPLFVASGATPTLFSEDSSENSVVSKSKTRAKRSLAEATKTLAGESVVKTEKQTPSKKGKVTRVTEKPHLYTKTIESINPQNQWIDLKVSPGELRASATLTTGQSFVWQAVEKTIGVEKVAIKQEDGQFSEPDKQVNNTASAWGTHDATEWIGVMRERVVSVRETPTTTLVRIVHDNSSKIVDEVVIRKQFTSYFQLDVELCPLYKEWSTCNCTRLPRIAAVIPGARVMRQDPVECLFSFICSSNNNIPRITLMLSRLRSKYGTKLLNIPTVDGGLLTFYAFPTLDQLRQATEKDLRDMGLGYRAKFIVDTRDLLIEKGGEDYLMKLRAMDDPIAVQEALIEFAGVGRKVADCVALFSLDQGESIPVDVHVLHIACRDYDPSIGKVKSMTPTIYKRVGDLFRDRFTRYAGWAHSLLFVAELPSFRPVLPPDMVEQMDKVSFHNISAIPSGSTHGIFYFETVERGRES